MAIDYQEGRSRLRVPPSNVDAEESVLGASMISADAVNLVMDHLEPGDFYKPAHQLIFEAISELFNGNQAVDAITVSDALGRRDQLERMGGIAYLTGLIDKVPTASNVEYYAKIVEENALRRRLLEASSGIGGLAYEDADIAGMAHLGQQLSEVCNIEAQLHPFHDIDMPTGRDANQNSHQGGALRSQYHVPYPM